MCWAHGGVGAEEVRRESGNVEGGHRSSRQDFRLSIVPGGSDVRTGSPDVNGRTVIGELGLGVVESRSRDRDYFLNAGGRVAARVGVVVSGGHDDGNTGVLVELKMESHVSGVDTSHPLDTYRFDSLVDAVGATAGKAHSDDAGSGGLDHIFFDPLNAGDTVGRRRGSVQSPSVARGSKKAYMSDHEPVPLSLRTFTAMILEALATP